MYDSYHTSDSITHNRYLSQTLEAKSTTCHILNSIVNSPSSHRHHTFSHDKHHAPSLMRPSHSGVHHLTDLTDTQTPLENFTRHTSYSCNASLQSPFLSPRIGKAQNIVHTIGFRWYLSQVYSTM